MGENGLELWELGHNGSDVALRVSTPRCSLLTASTYFMTTRAFHTCPSSCEARKTRDLSPVKSELSLKVRT